MRKPLLLWLAITPIIIGFVWSLFGIVEVWDGSFPQVEFQISFRDVQGRPIKGVTLAVTDDKGALAYGYPVTDYRVDSVPISNKDGLLLFHHVNLGTEFGGRCRLLFFAIPIGDCEAPKYGLHFLWRDKEVASYEYQQYLETKHFNWDSLPKIKRQFSELGSSPQSLPDHLRPERRGVSSILEYRIISKTIIVAQ